MMAQVEGPGTVAVNVTSCVSTLKFGAAGSKAVDTTSQRPSLVSRSRTQTCRQVEPTPSVEQQTRDWPHSERPFSGKALGQIRDRRPRLPPSRTKPDDQQRQGKADTDGPANHRRKSRQQVSFITQFTPGHAVTPRAPTGTARRPGMNDQKSGWYRGQFAPNLLCRMRARTRRSGCAPMVKKRLTVSLGLD